MIALLRISSDTVLNSMHITAIAIPFPTLPCSNCLLMYVETVSVFVGAMSDGVTSSRNAMMNVIHAGIPLSRFKGKDYIPDHALALSTFLNRTNFPIEELSYDTALSYLRRESIRLQNTERNYFLLTFQGKALGWAKNLGNRANNLYPQEWRIRSSHIPDNRAPLSIL